MSENLNKIIGKHVLFTFVKLVISIISSIICTFIFFQTATGLSLLFNILVEDKHFLFFSIVIVVLSIILFCIFFIKTSTYINLIGKIIIVLGVFILFFSVVIILIWVEMWFIGPNPISFNEFIDGLKSFYWKWYQPFFIPFLISPGIILIIWGIYVLRKKRLFKLKNPIQV